MNQESWVENIRQRLQWLHQRVATNLYVLRAKHQVAIRSRFLDRYFYHTLYGLIILLISCLLLLVLAWRAPRPFPDHILVTVEQGEHLGSVADNLESQDVVRSSFWLKVIITLRGGERNIIAGDYYIPDARTVFGIASILTKGEYGLSPIRVVIPEGLNTFEIAEVLSNTLPKFDTDKFIDLGVENEGYLFPDTYFFMPNEKPEKIVAMMRENFYRQINDLQEDIEKFEKPLEEVVIMASIVEDEARLLDTRRIVAGILWQRLRLDMPLQADATFKYYNGKTTFDLTLDDLADEDNPYNTYAHAGLPPTPITNPGLDSIRATVAPTNTDYLFFLSSPDGVMYYAEDFEGHKRNRELYLQ